MHGGKQSHEPQLQEVIWIGPGWHLVMLSSQIPLCFPIQNNLLPQSFNRMQPPTGTAQICTCYPLSQGYV